MIYGNRQKEVIETGSRTIDARQNIKMNVTTLLQSPPLESLILLYQCLLGMRRVTLRSLLNSFDSTVIPVDMLPLLYNS
jgi:hypothetical protein